MSDLREWIEAQLKRGYTRSQIKEIFIRKGYPQAAVAEVDKIGVCSRNISQEKISNKKNTHHIVLLILMIIVVAVTAIYIFSNKGSKINDTAAQQSNMAEQPIQTFSGKLIGLKNTTFTLEKDGKNFTITHYGSIADISIKKALQDKNIVNASLAELEQADHVLLAVAIENDKQLVRAVLVENMTKNALSTADGADAILK